MTKTLAVLTSLLMATGCLMPALAANQRAAASGRRLPAKATDVITADEAAAIRVYKDVNRAVVFISTYSVTPEMLLFNKAPAEGSGSGCTLTSDGYILTNYHVIKGAQIVRVVLWDGTTLPAAITGVDPQNDIAVLKIDPGKRILPVIPLGDSSTLEVGRRVFAIGAPFGLIFDRSMTEGIVSSLGRTVESYGHLIKGVIQTDAAVNPGNSGGPLLNSQGKMIGLNTAIFSSSPDKTYLGISLAIPINVVKEIFPQLIKHHRIIRPDLGVQEVRPVPNVGLMITRLVQGGPAEQAGLKGPSVTVSQTPFGQMVSIDADAADIISKIDEVKINGVTDLLSYIETKKPGDVVTLTIYRNKKFVKIPVKLTTSGGPAL